MEEISQIKKRILQYIEYKNITKQYFCEKTGISYGNMRGKSLKSELGGYQIAEILHIFGEISADWLLTGRGEMLRKTTPNAVDSEKKDKVCEKCAEKDKLILAQQKTIDTQSELIDCLQTLKNNCKQPEKKSQTSSEFPTLSANL